MSELRTIKVASEREALDQLTVHSTRVVSVERTDAGDLISIRGERGTYSTESGSYRWLVDIVVDQPTLPAPRPVVKEYGVRYVEEPSEVRFRKTREAAVDRMSVEMGDKLMVRLVLPKVVGPWVEEAV